MHLPFVATISHLASKPAPACPIDNTKVVIITIWLQLKLGSVKTPQGGCAALDQPVAVVVPASFARSLSHDVSTVTRSALSSENAQLRLSRHDCDSNVARLRWRFAPCFLIWNLGRTSCLLSPGQHGQNGVSQIRLS
jgi:hypothetical protein